jgi:Peptidyl-tRNA hydrolase
MRPIILVLLLLSAATNQTASFSNLFMLNTVVKFRSCTRHPVLLMHASAYSTQSDDVNDNEETSGEKPISDKSQSRSKGFKTHTSTRHNIGFRILDEFAASKKTTMKFSSKFNADYGAVRIGDKNVGLLKPGTYINNSGGPIKKIMENFKLLPKDILIVADDIALDCGVLRLREKGSHGGHNGHRGKAHKIS